MSDSHWKTAIQEAIDNSHWNMKSASLAAGKGDTFVRDALKRDKIPSMDNLIKVFDVLNIDLAYGLTGDKSRSDHVPLLSLVSAGKLTEHSTEKHNGQFIQLNALPSGNYFALEVDGSSMNRIAPHGAIIIVDRKRTALKDKAFYVFTDQGEATFKRYLSSPDRLTPYSTDEHESIYPDHTPVPVGEVIRVILDL